MRDITVFFCKNYMDITVKQILRLRNNEGEVRVTDAQKIYFQIQKNSNITIFNNTLWREILNSAGHNLLPDNIPLTIISPWGFEVTNDKKYLTKHLRRFYSYVGVPPHLKGIINKTALAKKYANNILTKLNAISPQLVSDFVILFEHDQLNHLEPQNYICKPNDKLLDIQIRFTDDILDDYATYIISSLDEIDLGIGEAKNHQTNQKARWRMYQLYVMHENIFHHLLPPMTDIENKIYRSIFILIDNMIQFFYSPDEMVKTATPWEAYVFDELIKRRVELMKQAICDDNPDNNIVIEQLSYHAEDNLRLKIAKNHYLEAIKKIKDSYLNFI